MSSTWRDNYPFIARIEGDLKYAGLLLICAIIATLLRKKASLRFKRNIDGCIGLLITIIVCREVAFYSLFIVLIHLIAINFCPKRWLAQFSFFGTFTYLGFLRIAHNYGLPKLQFIGNAIQLLMTLRVIGLSYEISDSYEAEKCIKKNDDESKKDVNRRYIIIPTTFEAFNYFYSFTGLYTGPYYTYQTYYDAMHSEHLQKISVRSLIFTKMRTLCWSLPALIILYALGPVEILKTEIINEYSSFTCFVLSSLAFVYLRMRIYTAWMIAESICILSGIGVYPETCQSIPGVGPRKIEGLKDAGKLDIKYNDETINNLDIPHVECSDGFRSGMRAWNRSVQFWLANFVYKRSYKAIRMPYTMFVSAFWHGVHPGYFLSFLTIPLCTTAEDLLFKLVPADELTGKRPMWFEIIWRFIRIRGFEMMACGFLLLTWEDTVRLWNRLYWWLHFTMIAIALVSFTIVKFKKLSKKRE